MGLVAWAKRPPLEFFRFFEFSVAFLAFLSVSLTFALIISTFGAVMDVLFSSRAVAVTSVAVMVAFHFIFASRKLFAERSLSVWPL